MRVVGKGTRTGQRFCTLVKLNGNFFHGLRTQIVRVGKYRHRFSSFILADVFQKDVRGFDVFDPLYPSKRIYLKSVERHSGFRSQGIIFFR